MSVVRNQLSVDIPKAAWERLIEQSKQCLEQMVKTYREALAASKQCPAILLPDKKPYILPKGKTSEVLLEKIKIEKFVLLDLFIKASKPATSFKTLAALDQHYQELIESIPKYITQTCHSELKLLADSYALPMSSIIEQLIKPETFQQIIRIYHLIVRQMFLLSWFKSGSHADAQDENGDDAGVFKKLVISFLPVCQDRLLELRQLSELNFAGQAQQIEVVAVMLRQQLSDKFGFKQDGSTGTTDSASAQSLLREFSLLLDSIPSDDSVNALCRLAEKAVTAADKDLLSHVHLQSKQMIQQMRKVWAALTDYLDEFLGKQNVDLSNLSSTLSAIILLEQAIQDNVRLREIRAQVEQMMLSYFADGGTAIDEISRELQKLSVLFSAQVSGSRSWIDAGLSVCKSFSSFISAHQAFTASYADHFPAHDEVKKTTDDLGQLKNQIETSAKRVKSCHNSVYSTMQTMAVEMQKMDQRLQGVARAEIIPKKASLIKRHWWKVGIGIVVGCAIGILCPWALGLGLIAMAAIGIAGAAAGGGIAFGVSYGADSCAKPNDVSVDVAIHQEPDIENPADRKHFYAIPSREHSEDQVPSFKTKRENAAFSFAAQPDLLFSRPEAGAPSPSTPLLDQHNNYATTYKGH